MMVRAMTYEVVDADGVVCDVVANSEVDAAERVYRARLKAGLRVDVFSVDEAAGRGVVLAVDADGSVDSEAVAASFETHFIVRLKSLDAWSVVGVQLRHVARVHGRVTDPLVAPGWWFSRPADALRAVADRSAFNAAVDAELDALEGRR